MAHDDDFELWLGRIASDRPLRQCLAAGLARAGRSVGRRSRFTGARIGRGSGMAGVLRLRDAQVSFSARRVVVKTRIVRLGQKGLGAARAHLRYLERDSTTREGERGVLYGPADDRIDGKTFLERGANDRHHFRFIVAPEDGAEYDDLKPLVRRLMIEAERDLGTKLDWVAVDHFNTGHPHAHIVVRGRDDRGQDLVIARDYLTHGFRARAIDLINLDLGPRTDAEILRSWLNEIGQERFTDLDRRLLRAIDCEGLIRPAHRDPLEQSLRAGRLQTLGRLSLATEVSRGVWALDPELEPTLRRIGTRGDIIRTMQQAMHARCPERTPSDWTIHDPAAGRSVPIIGRLVMRGLSDEHADRHYLIVDGIDGISHYIDIGVHSEPIPEDAIVRITPQPVVVRAADRTVAEVAAANDGRYTIDAHLRHDRQATDAFAETHVRRLEAIRRMTGGVTREAEGSWLIAPDHLDRAEAYERVIARTNPVIIDTLSAAPLDQLPRHDGATWLDRELMAEHPANLQRGFGAEVRNALATRQQWLIEQELALIDGDTVRYRAAMIATLQQRELRRVATQIGTERGLAFVEARPGTPAEGKLVRPVQIGDRKFALIEKSREFTLVPWRPVLERAIGKQVFGLVRGSSVDWTIGRSRGPSIGM